MTRPLALPIALLLLATPLLGGCAIPIAGVLTIGQLGTIASLGLTATTGKGLVEHGMDAATGEDCNVLGSVFNKDRALCEVRGSDATKNDFKGFFQDEHGEEEKVAAPARKPVLMRVNGKLVYTMAPVVKPADIANAEVVRVLPPVAPPDGRSIEADAPSRPVLLRVKGKLIYTMSPVSRAQDIHSGAQRKKAAPVRHP